MQNCNQCMPSDTKYIYIFHLGLGVFLFFDGTTTPLPCLFVVLLCWAYPRALALSQHFIQTAMPEDNPHVVCVRGRCLRSKNLLCRQTPDPITVRSFPCSEAYEVNEFKKDCFKGAAKPFVSSLMIGCFVSLIEA